jgi:FKBP-type peptidyl-prolyl cis-trans isomerase (trigger factor)
MKFKLNPIKKNTASIIFTATSKEVAEAEDHAISHLGKDVQIKGFRKGKAPINLVKDSLDPAKVREHAINTLLQKELPKVIKANKLDLIGNPQLANIETPKDKGWILTIDLPLMPKVNLGKYDTKVKAALKKEGKKLKEFNQKVNLVCDTLIKEATLEVPESLIQAEIQKSLSRLIDQTQTLGVTVEQYLKSAGKTLEQVKTEYQKQAEDSLKLEFILLEVAKEKKVTATDAEALEFINATGDAKTKEVLSDPHQLPYIKTILVKRKAIDALIGK